MDNTCPICSNAASLTNAVNSDTCTVKCAICGDFEISRTAALTILRDGSMKDKLFIVSGYIRNQNIKGFIPELDTNNEPTDLTPLAVPL